MCETNNYIRYYTLAMYSCETLCVHHIQHIQWPSAIVGSYIEHFGKPWSNAMFNALSINQIDVSLTGRKKKEKKKRTKG